MEQSQSPISAERARELLRRERDRIEAALADLRTGKQSELEEIEATADPTGSDEAALIEEVEVDDALARQLREELEAVERAEQRLQEGTYGLSVESGEPIPAGRLEAIPWAERTAEEQSNR